MYDINRNLIMVKPKRPFWDWVKSVEPDTYDPIFETMPEQGSAFLIPELENEDKLQEYLKANYMIFFEQKLLAWYTDEKVFPKNRSFKMFNEWFTVEYNSIVQDTEDGKIEKREG